jgi:HCOMODA/2-hydroxy-3-carboxy-muconic semialdehyde decarboxylase
MDKTEKYSRLDVVAANHILANEAVLDAFGHVSVRHPVRTSHFLLAGSQAPSLVTADSILEFDENSEPVAPAGQALYIERFIHGEIYRARPDVMAVCHHHAAAVMPFCISGTPLVPVYQHGALMGPVVPMWDSRTEFGDTDLLVRNGVQAASLARALDSHTVLLMRRHGAIVVGTSLVEMVFRAVTSCMNAEFQRGAMLMGTVSGLSPGEIEKSGRISPPAMLRAFELWRRKAAAVSHAADDGTTPQRNPT